MTIRDDVWDESLTMLANRGKLKASDLPFGEDKRHTVRRTLREMENKGWFRRDSPSSSIWRLGSKAELLLDVSEDVIDQSRE